MMNGISDWISIFSNESFYVFMDLARNHWAELTLLIYCGGWLVAILARRLGRLVGTIRRGSRTQEAIDYRALTARKPESTVQNVQEPLHINSPSNWWARLIMTITIVIVSTSWHWHQQWSGTGTNRTNTTRTSSARNVGVHIYSELQAVEPDVLSGKIKDPSDPRLETIKKEIDSYPGDQKAESFGDARLLAGLMDYQSTLALIVMSNADSSSVDRARNLEDLQQQKSDIEKYLR